MHDTPRAAPIKAHKLLSLQALRAVAALCVVVHHAGYDADTVALKSGAAPVHLDRVFDWTFGIHLFFVISGFIMVRTARGFGERGGPWRFLGRRLLRIAPLYWLMTSLVLVGALLAPGLLNVPVEGWRLALGSYAFVPVPRVNGEIRPVLGQGWTLNFEMVFYVVFATSMMFRRRTGLWLLASSLVALVVAGKLWHPGTPASMVWTDGLLLEFLLGIGIGLALETGVRLGAVAALGLAGGGVVAAVLLGPAGGLGLDLEPWIAQGGPAALILAAAVWGPAWPSRPAVLALAALGDASYSLYLVHPFAIRLLRVAWERSAMSLWPLSVFVGSAMLAAIGASLLLFRLVERPMTSALHHSFGLSNGPGQREAAGIAPP